jgi:4-hydroxybenzoate polyprenyltransferase
MNMKKLTDWVEKMVQKIEDSPTSFYIWLFSFTSLIAIRILMENWTPGIKGHRGFLIFYEFFDSFLIAYLISLWIINKFLKVEFKKASNILLWGYSVIVVPPIVDYIFSRGKGFFSFYVFDGLPGLIIRFFTFFGDRPDIGITYGIRTEILLAVILILIYAYLKSKNILKSLGISVLVYSILFILGTFPSWITIAVKGFSAGFLRVGEIDVAQMFFSPFSLFSREINEITSALITKTNLVYLLILSAIIILGLFTYQRKKFYSFLKNIRLPQIFYHEGLLMAGISVGIIFNPHILFFNFFNTLGFLVISEAVILSWLASVVANDIFDEKIDIETNAQRPLIKKDFTPEEYKTLGMIFFAFAVYLAILVNPKIAFLLIAYQGIAWIYSAWPLRLKRFAFISTFVSAIASLLIFFSGYVLLSPSQDISGIPMGIMVLLIIAYTFSIPIKDFKDAPGDKKDGVYTIPVVFGEYWGKIIVGSGIFISFLLSVIFLNEFRLFWWALLIGGISFWLVVKMKKDPEVSPLNYRSIFWWMLGTVSIYGLILVKIIFL